MANDDEDWENLSDKVQKRWKERHQVVNKAEVIEGWDDLTNKFLKTRKGGKTVHQARGIMILLLVHYKLHERLGYPPDECGWTRPKYILEELKKYVPDLVCPIHGSTFYRLLDDLEKCQFIERKGKPMFPHRPGRLPVYYRTRIFDSIPFPTQEDLQKQLSGIIDDLSAAKKLLIKYHEKDPNYDVERDIAEERKRVMPSPSSSQ